MFDSKLLFKLLKIYSPSNFEDSMVDFLSSLKLKRFKSFSTPNKTIIFMPNKIDSSKKTILLDAHIDTIHYRVKSKTADYLVVQSIGFDATKNIGLPVKVLSHSGKIIPGIVVNYPPHLPKKNEVSSKNYAFVDIGDENIKDVLIGDPIVFDVKPQMIGKNIMTGYGLDNKVGVFVLLKLLSYFDSHNSKYNILFNFSSKEEIGNVSLDHVDDMQIDEIIVVDTDTAVDQPNIAGDANYTVIKSAHGPTVSRNTDDSTMIFERLYKISKEKKIPIQITFVNGWGGTNATNYGVFKNSLVQFLGIPIRNMHSAVETVDIRDIVLTMRLLMQYLV
jgi:endoglucanase